MTDTSPPALFDIGINLAHDSYDADRGQVLRRALDAGVGQLIVTGSCLESTERAITLVAEVPRMLRCTAGVHPHHASSLTADVLETLGPVTICCSLRDSMIWEAPDGAVVQWTACGEGLMDWKAYAARWRQLCPDVPIMIETISGGPRTFAYKKPEFWQHYDKRPDKLAKFEALAKRGRPIPAFRNPTDPKERAAAQQAFQKSEIEKSIAYLRREIGLGVRV